MAEEQATLDLRVLSPSIELEGGLAFARLPVTLTVSDLRHRIHDAMPSRPSPGRMRLIYRGRVLANNDDTLETIFGADNIRESRDQSLHLVLSPIAIPASSPVPRSSTAPTNPFRPPQPPTAARPLQRQMTPTHPAPPTQAAPQQRQVQIQVQPQVQPQPQLLQAAAHIFNLPLPAPIQQQLAHAFANAAQPQAHHPPPPPPPPPAHHPPPPPAYHPPPPPPPPPASQAANPTGPPYPNPNLYNGQTVRQAGVGANGVQWSVVINDMNLPAQGDATNRTSPPLFPQSQAAQVPARTALSPDTSNIRERMLPLISLRLQAARSDVQNATTLCEAPWQAGSNTSAAANYRNWRNLQVQNFLSSAYRNLELATNGFGQVFAYAPPTQAASCPTLSRLRQSLNELKLEADNIALRFPRERSNRPPASQPSTLAAPLITSIQTTPIQSAPIQPRHQSAAQVVPVDFPPELYLLSSPQGPVGLVFDQHGTYLTAPIVPTLSFQQFSNGFARNRQLIAGLGQQIVRSSNQPQNAPTNIPPSALQPTPGSGAPQPPQPAPANHPANNAANVPPANDRLADVGGHIWLILKLACFVYFFAGGGSGYYRPILLGIIAGIVYLAQTGMFEEQFNMMRRHFEALLPIGALADRVAAPIHAPAARVAPEATPNQRTAENRNLTPQQAAQRLLQQRREERFGWLRETARSLERAFALFVASLWPGIGERMVHAQEERDRLERVARREEEERREQDEREQRENENKRREEEATRRQVTGDKDATVGDGIGVENGEGSGSGSGSSKGEEKIEEATADTRVTETTHVS